MPQIEGQAYSLEEARREVSGLGILHSSTQQDIPSVKTASVEEIFVPSQGRLPESTLNQAEKTILSSLKPIQLLADRLDRPNLIVEQQASISNRDITLGPDSQFVERDGLVYLKLKDVLYMPPSLEGVVLSYSPLICGHVGWVRLYRFLLDKYYMPDMKNKARMISTTCQACILSNPGSHRKSPYGGVISSYPMEIVTADLLEVESNIGKKNHKVLIIVDYFTKMIFAYDLVSFTGKSFLARFKDFLSATGMITKLLIVDNASIFSNLEVLKFLQLMGITKVRGNTNHSRSRGLVESSIRILQTLLRKLLLLSDRYNFEELLFLAPVLLNRARNPITELSPYEMLYCRDLSDLGTLGRKLDPPYYLLFNSQVKEDITRLKGIMDKRIQSVSERIQKEKDKYLSRVNKGKSDKPPLPQGTLVFLRNYSIPKNGRAQKFCPFYLRSPQVVMTASRTSVVTLRLSDSFISRHHPDDV